MHAEIIATTGVASITPHGLRHTNATLELESGTHPRVVAERLGHRNVAITLDTYSHVSADLQRAAADALDARLSKSETEALRATT
jgi:integrase